MGRADGDGFEHVFFFLLGGGVELVFLGGVEIDMILAEYCSLFWWGMDGVYKKNLETMLQL